MFRKNSGLAPVVFVIGGATIALIIGIGIGLRKISIPGVTPSSPSKTEQSSSVNTSTEKKELPSKTSGNREVGNAGDLYPYGKMDDKTYREVYLDRNGGSLPIELSGNITMYFTFPMGLSEGLLATFTPYYSMPTASDAVPLSNELGYGLDFTLEGTRHGELPHNMYLVFDLDQGKTVKEIRKNPKLQYFCDPGAETFNPSVCAYLNNVPLTNHTSDTYAVVSPTRSEGHSKLLTMRPTVPIGFDNLLVIEIDEEATYIPQKLSKELLVDLIDANLGSNTNIRTHEATIQMVRNNLYTSEDFTGIDANMYGLTFQEAIKTYYELPKFVAFYNKLKNNDNLSEKEKQIAQANTSFTTSFDVSTETNIKNLRTYVRQLLFRRNTSDDILSAIGYIKRLEQNPIVDLSADKEEFITWMDEELIYYQEEDDLSFVTNLLMAALLIYDKDLSKMPPSLVKRMIAAPQVMAQLDGLTVGPEEWKKRAREIIDKICSNPNSSMKQIGSAIDVAGRIGDTAGQEKCREKLCASLEHNLKNKEQSPIEVASDWTKYQAACANGDENYAEYLKKLSESYDKQVCTTLMEKNLKNFAWNEVKCSRFQDEDGYIGDKRFKTLEELKEQIRNNTR